MELEKMMIKDFCGVNRLEQCNDMLRVRVDEHSQEGVKSGNDVSSQKLEEERAAHPVEHEVVTYFRSDDQLSQTPLSQMGEKVNLKLQGQMKTSKREIQSLEGSSQQDDTTEVQNTDASDSRSWPVLNAYEIKRSYPKDVKPDDVWSILHNDGKWKLSQQQHKQRLDAIALRATEWLINHGWDVRSNDDKRALYEKVLSFFNTETKATAKKLFECVVRQDKKNKQAWIIRAGHYIANATPFTHDKLQSAKKDLVKSFEEWSARDRRINKKIAHFNKLHWSEKIFKREGGFRYGKIHASEMDALNKKLQYNEVIEPKLKEIEKKSGEMNYEFQAKINEWMEKSQVEELSDKKRYQLFTEGLGLLMTAVSKGLVDVHANQEKLTLLTSHQLQRMEESIVGAVEHTSKGVFGSLAMDTLSGMIATVALVMGIKAASHGTA